ncbi:hypothetical protein RRG08_036988 [Elysia crispata]|uniref:Uncharacterized protein n=1 Tax=Elysia crispata TaxID=231223 RepID=A0AAE1CM81_9GAST|nr:hypothetical protein RRG08_036988 [Elysia crispata]
MCRQVCRMLHRLEGFKLLSVYKCPHHPEQCPWSGDGRAGPAPGLRTINGMQASGHCPQSETQTYGSRHASRRAWGKTNGLNIAWPSRVDRLVGWPCCSLLAVRMLIQGLFRHGMVCNLHGLDRIGKTEIFCEKER